MLRPDTTPIDDLPQSARTELTEVLDFPPLPDSGGTDPNDHLRCPTSFRLAHEGSSHWSAAPHPINAGFWAETSPGLPRTFLQISQNELARLSTGDAPLLILGAKVTGKRELAQAVRLHELNRRRDKLFGEVDCEEGQGSETIGAELFGRSHGEGRPAGKLFACNGGTLLLRTLERLPAECARRLVHFLRHGEARPLDSDRAGEALDVRLLATTRDKALLPNDLLEEFGECVKLAPLKEMKGAITLILSEFLRPYDVIKDVHVSWLLDLLCHDWPGNVGELQRYCEKARVHAAEMRCGVLCAAIDPITRARRDSMPALSPKRVVNSLLALSERRFREKPDWPRIANVPAPTANSLRLLAQLLDDGRSFFRRGVRGPFPYYFHPYKIPLALFFEGCRCPPCYEVDGLLPMEKGAPCCLDEFLCEVAAIASNPRILTENEEVRRVFCADPDVITTRQPSESFLNWVGSLKASVPKYEAMRSAVSIPALHNLGATKPTRTAAPRRTRGDVHSVGNENGFLPGIRPDPAKFKWADVSAHFFRFKEQVTFAYGEAHSGPHRLAELAFLKNRKTRKERTLLTKEGMLLERILKNGATTFTLAQVEIWCSASRASASERVRCLSNALWRLFLGTGTNLDKKRRAIVPMRSDKGYRVAFKVFDAGYEACGDELVLRTSRAGKLTGKAGVPSSRTNVPPGRIDGNEDVGRVLQEANSKEDMDAAAHNAGLSIFKPRSASGRPTTQQLSRRRGVGPK
jgi:hypothetical protein